MDARLHPRRRSILPVVAASALVLAACSQQPTRTAAPAPAAPVPPQVFVYPAAGQDPARLDRDRYECHLWAVRESRFDPSVPGVPAAQRVTVVRTGPPPGAGVAAGAVSGAVLGAAVAGPWHAGEGALIGAAAGAMVGAAAEGAAAEEARRAEEAQLARSSSGRAQWSQRAEGYRRAITACLEARGYAVR